MPVPNLNPLRYLRGSNLEVLKVHLPPLPFPDYSPLFPILSSESI
jgi:hypothetical protein